MFWARARRLTAPLAISVAAGTAVAMAGGPSVAATAGRTMDIQVLSFNDFHGNLEPPGGSGGRVITGHTLTGGVVTDTTVDAGGVEYLATNLRRARVGHPNTLTVAAGDLIGASPLLSAAFHDEPTIEAMNKIGLDASAVGNHEFDEGYRELQRMQRGGCLPDGAGKDNQNSCPDGRFKGAWFRYLAANVKNEKSGRTILPAYTIKRVNGAKVGFIGMTLKETPDIVTRSGVAGLTFTDEVRTANALVPELVAQGVKAIIVLIHQGATPAVEQWMGPDGNVYDANSPYDYTCGRGGSLTEDSAILPIAANLSPQIDMVISGHTHQPYVCNVPDPAGQQRLVTSASSFGRLFTETTLKYDMRRGDIVRASVSGANMIVSRDVPPDRRLTQLIDRYRTLLGPIATQRVGTVTSDIVRAQNAAGESPLGDLIADAQFSDPSVVTGSKVPVVAFMNPGGIRADLTYAAVGAEGDGVVTFEEAFTVQPFNNYLVSMDLTGADIHALLEQQWSGSNVALRKFLQISSSMRYSWTETSGTPTVVPGSVTINGEVVANDTSRTYRVVTNNFLSDGGDAFTAFTGGQDKYFGELDIDAFTAYLGSHSPNAPLPLNRITKVG